MNKILFFNPRSAAGKARFPNSLLSVAATITGKYEWALVDGNLEQDPYQKLCSYLASGEYKYVGFTVMPGPQTKQAIPFAKKIREEFPFTTMIWGGYFPGNHFQAVLDSGYVDFVVNGPGEHAFPQLIDALEHNRPYEFICNLIYRSAAGHMIKTKKEDLFEQDPLPDLPYEALNTFYPLQRYLGKTFLGRKTMSYHSSIGCPFSCAFCAVVPLYEARWKAKSARKVYRDVKYLKDTWGADAIEFTDNNFFVSEKRTVELASLLRQEEMSWWGMARIDTLDHYADASLALMREAGCKIIFFGAESGNDAILRQLDKGGKQTGEQAERFAARLRRFDIIPEYSFILGTPAPTPEKVMEQIDFEISFIRKVKNANPATEIIIYLYSPVPTEGSELYERVQSLGFRFPAHLEEWISPQWEGFDARKNPLTPWLQPHMVNKIRNFETVLNGYYPTVSDIKLNSWQRKLLRLSAGMRYKMNFLHYPYEIRLLQRMWKYRQPETQGF
ncbi:MAG: B12-binding domain-containing radical SAM protein [Adhaeribacter sp.]